jgi:DNA invertase Pin-like site-specific DNA recombinase
VSAFTVRKASSAWGRALAAIERDRPEYLLVYRQDRIGHAAESAVCR